MLDRTKPVIRALAVSGLAAIIFASAAIPALYAQSPAWPKTCNTTINEIVNIGQKTNGYPNECLLSDSEWANCLERTKPFADDPRLVAQAEEQWKQKCHEALLARYPDADETQAQRAAEARAEANRSIASAVLLVLGAVTIICLVAFGVWIAAPVIVPLALLVIALHFLGCF
jgi:hypothetical protein